MKGAVSFGWNWKINPVIFVGNFWVKADWIGSFFFKGTSNYNKHSLDAHKKSWQHLASVLAKQEVDNPSSGPINVKHKNRKANHHRCLCLICSHIYRHYLHCDVTYPNFFIHYVIVLGIIVQHPLSGHQIYETLGHKLMGHRRRSWSIDTRPE